MEKLLYRPKEAAQVLGIGRATLYDLMHAGKIRSVKDGHMRFITRDALCEYVRILKTRRRSRMTARPARRRVNGDGSLTRRADGRWMGRYYAWTTGGVRKRVTVYGKTRQEAADKMREAQERNRQGIPVPDRTWKLAAWLDYWLEHVVAPNRRPATYRLYEMTVRLYLKPEHGRHTLVRLSAARVQAFLNGHLAAGRSARQVQVMRTVLSSALTRAMREELIMRNVARLAELPGWER